MNNKLLIVDDEDVLLRSLKPYFTRKGYVVFTALKGEDGLELLKVEDPDLMILDLHLKEGIQGVEVLKQAIALKPTLKIAVVTGFGKDDDVIKMCLDLGAKAVLKKPITLDVLKEELEKLKGNKGEG